MEYFSVGAGWGHLWGLSTGLIDGFRTFRGCFGGWGRSVQGGRREVALGGQGGGPIPEACLSACGSCGWLERERKARGTQGYRKACVG